MKRKEWLPRILPGGVLLVLLLRYPKEMTDGIRQGMTLCATALIPSLFPFFVLCSFFIKSGLCDALGKVASPVVQKVFHLPGAAAGAVLLGFCGGYPVGTRMTRELWQSGRITKQNAQRMCLFCVAAGPAFVTGAVGTTMLRNRACGWILFAAITLSNLAIGILLRFTDLNVTFPKSVEGKKLPLVKAFCESVGQSGMGMIPMCAWVLLFSGICSVAKLLPERVFLPVCSLLEVTNGCKTAVLAGVSLPILAAILGFGGFSVHCQILPDLLDCEVKLSQFWVSRVVSGALSAVFCKGLLHLFPQAETVALLRNDTIIHATTATVPASVALLFTAVVFILNTVQEVSGFRKLSK